MCFNKNSLLSMRLLIWVYVYAKVIKLCYIENEFHNTEDWCLWQIRISVSVFDS